MQWSSFLFCALELTVMSKQTQAIVETADSVNVIGIVTSAISEIAVCTLVLLLLQYSNFTVSLLQAVALSFFLSLAETNYCLIFFQTLAGFCVILH